MQQGLLREAVLLPLLLPVLLGTWCVGAKTAATTVISRIVRVTRSEGDVVSSQSKPQVTVYLHTNSAAKYRAPQPGPVSNILTTNGKPEKAI